MSEARRLFRYEKAGLGLYYATLPFYYATFLGADGVPYYYADDNYYQWQGNANE